MDQVEATLTRYYQGRWSSRTARFYVTPEHLRLLRARARAERDAAAWHRLLAEVRERLPEYAVRDRTNLAAGQCREMHLLLHPGQALLDDDRRLLLALGGARQDLVVYLSVLAPVYHIVVGETTYHFGEDRSSYRVIAERSARALLVEGTVEAVLRERGYRRLAAAEARRTVHGVETAHRRQGEAALFHCLFSDLVDHF